jgi:hypothetical protein
MISNLSFSQSGYPKQIVIDKDTLVAITPQQVKTLNLLNVDFKECNDIKKALILKVESDSLLITKQNEYEGLLVKRLDAQDVVMKNDNIIYKSLQSDLDKANKLCKKEKVKVGIMGGICAILVGFTTMLLIMK